MIQALDGQVFGGSLAFRQPMEELFHPAYQVILLKPNNNSTQKKLDGSYLRLATQEVAAFRI